MRESSISIQDVLSAGKAILASGRVVNGYSLRNEIGSGRSDRLIKIWSQHRDSGTAESGQARIPERAHELISAHLKQSQSLVNTTLMDLAAVLGESARAEALAEIESLRALVDEQQSGLAEADTLVRKLEQTNEELEVRLDQALESADQLQGALSVLQAQAVEDSSALIDVNRQLFLANDRVTELCRKIEVDQVDLARCEDEVLTLRERVAGLVLLSTQKDGELVDARRDAQLSREREATVNGQLLQLQRDRDVDLELLARLRLEVSASALRVSQSEAEAEAYKGQLAELNDRVGTLLSQTKSGVVANG